MTAPFHDRGAFRPVAGYKLLPFRFLRLQDDAYLATNEVGEYVVLSRSDLTNFVDGTLDPSSASYRALKSRHFLFDPGAQAPIDLLALKYRTRAERLSWFTGLHIFVVTLRCDHSCRYCQVSRQTESRTQYDMSKEHAAKALDLVWRSPSPVLKIELQGGEPLLNFELVRFIVETAVERNRTEGRHLELVIASNLSRLSDDILAFCREHGVKFSTSLDGPADLHDQQRPVPGGGSHRMTCEGIARIRTTLGADHVAALMTTTEASLPRVEDIIDEYVRLGFSSIFLRSLSPFGFAARRSLTDRYDVEQWLAFYRRGLAHILELNRRGYRMREELTTILLHKIFSTEGTTYVDLQSPAGIGIGALIYNYDGAVFASDESRMLAEMGDESFRLGHVDADSYEAMMTSPALLDPLLDTMPEGAPMCSDCAFLPYCGSDPVLHRATQGDTVGHKAFSIFCKKQMGVLRHLFDLLENDPTAKEILLGWMNRC